MIQVVGSDEPNFKLNVNFIMKGLQRLSKIRYLSEKDKNWKHRDLFRILNHNDLWITAYETLKGNKGSLTPGSTSETMDGMSIDRLNRLRTKVMDESYRFNPVKRTYIKRPDGRFRPLGMPTANDKIVQEVLRMILEAIYEPCFSKTSFGFRPGLGCHDALEHIERKFRWVDYVIEGGVEQAYPSINRDVLVNRCLRKRIRDERFLNLVWRCLKCGVLDNNTYEKTVTGIPQRGVIGPILTNIYYNELDDWVEAKMIEYNQSVSSRKSPAYISIERKIGRRAKRLPTLCSKSIEYKNLVKEIKTLRKLRITIPSLADPRVKIEYVRYADDWMIGVAGDKLLSFQIKTEVSKFIQNELKQSINSRKTRITNLRKGTATFLGYHIFLPETKTLHKYKGAKTTTQTIRRGNNQLRFDLPQDRVIKRLVERGYVRSINNRIRSISKADYAHLERHAIVAHYKSLILDILAYYSGATKRGRLQYIQYLIHMSCAMTLGHHHNMSCSKIFKKYGKSLEVKIPDRPNKSVQFPYKTRWLFSERHWKKGTKFRDPFSKYASRLTRSSLDQKCLVCHSIERVEMHHVKHVRKQGERYGGFHKEMALLNRKQIPLCRKCHMKVHRGLYDGIALSELQKKAKL